MQHTFTEIPGHEWAAIIFVGVWAVTFLSIHIRWSKRNHRILLEPVFGLAAVLAALVPAAVAGLFAVVALTTGFGAAITGVADLVVTWAYAAASNEPVAQAALWIAAVIVVGAAALFFVNEWAVAARADEDVRRANPKIALDKRLYKERVRARSAEIRAENAASRTGLFAKPAQTSAAGNVTARRPAE